MNYEKFIKEYDTTMKELSKAHEKIDNLQDEFYKEYPTLSPDFEGELGIVIDGDKFVYAEYDFENRQVYIETQPYSESSKYKEISLEEYLKLLNKEENVND